MDLADGTNQIARIRTIQLLVSTKDHLYIAENVEAGICAFQMIGSVGESSLWDILRFLSTQKCYHSARHHTKW